MSDAVNEALVGAASAAMLLERFPLRAAPGRPGVVSGKASGLKSLPHDSWEFQA